MPSSLKPLALLVGLVLTAGTALAQGAGLCDTEISADGMPPMDYRGDQQRFKPIERVHFTAQVEQLKRGQSGSQPGPDISYMLGKVPNHHRALLSLVRLGDKLKNDRDPHMPRPISCYFERAIAFRGDDPLVRMIYAMHLNNMKRSADAKLQLARAAHSAGDNALTHFNIGMVSFDLGLHEEALAAAHRAQRLGLERPELRQRLERVGRWSDATAAAAPAASAASTTASAAPSAAAASAQ